MRRLAIVLFAGCACPTPAVKTPVAVKPVATTAAPCDAVRAKVEALYRAEAQAKEPLRVDEATADNTAMVMADCAKDPAARVPCLEAAHSVAEIQDKCIAPLDEEGSEGTSL
jgi:hypothetical protein